MEGNYGKRFLSLLLAAFMVLGMLPTMETHVHAAEADGWYWDGSTLYIKDGAITGANFIKAVQEKTGSTLSTVYYSTSNLRKPAGFRAGGTQISSGTTYTSFADGSTYYASTYARSGVSVSGTVTGAFTVKHYYAPTVTISGVTGVTGTVTPSASGATKIYSGTNNAVVTVPHVDGYTVTATYGGKTVDLTQETTNWTGTFTATDSTAVTVTYTLETVEPATITFETAGTGSGSVNFGGLTAEGTLTGGTYTLTINPSDLNGADGSAMYVDKVEINGTALAGSYSGGVYTASYIVENEERYTVKVTYGTVTLTNQGGTLELNGYVDTSGLTDDYSARLNNLASKIVKAVLDENTTTGYTVYIWFNPGLGQPETYYETDSGWVTGYANRLTVPAYGTTGTQKVKIVKAASSDGKIPAITLETTVTTKETREPATVTAPVQPTSTYNTQEEFLAALKDATVVKGNSGTVSNDDAGLTLTPTWNGNECTVTWEVTKAGTSWLTNSGTLGTYSWTISEYKVIFVNDDGTKLSETEYPYGTEASAIVAPTATKADKVDDAGNVMATYTFAGWTPTVDTVTKAVTYTATYTEVAKTYTITWVNGNETTTETYAYGTTPTAPEASKTSTAQYHFTNGTWGTIATVTGDATYTATFTEELRSYTITWVNGDETTTTTVAYGETPVAPTAATKSPKKDEAGNVMATYTNGSWGTIVTVTGVATYTATFTEVPAQYTVTWIIKGETTTQTLEYGTQITHGDVEDYSTADKNYYFKGWKIGDSTETTAGANLPTVTGDVTITAVFSEAAVYQVTLVYGNGDDDLVIPVDDTDAYKYTVPEETPTRTGYRFDGWHVNGAEVKAGEVLTITANTTITADWSELFTITWMNDGAVYKTETDKYITGETPVKPADPTKAADAQYTYTFTGWDPAVGAITGDTEYVAQYSKTVNSYVVKFVDVDGTTVLNEQTLNYGETPVYQGAALNKQYYSYSWTPAIGTVTGAATYTLVWTADNDVNSNGVADELETGTVTLVKEGNGNVTLTPAGNATLVNQEGNVYTYLYDSTDAANKVINVSTSLIDTDNTDGNVDYLISAPATVNVGETLTVKFGTHTLSASNGTVAINGYYEGKQDQVIFDTLKADVLKAAGLNGVTVSNYTVKVNLRGSYYDLDKMTGWANILNWETFFLAVEVPESGRQFTITDNTTGVSKTVTMKIVDSRPSAGLNDQEFTDVKVIGDGETGLNSYVDSLLTDKNLNPNGVTVTKELTEGSWPPAAAGVTTKLVYTVTYADSADYIGDSAKLTVYVQSAYNNCTVVADEEGKLIAGGSLTVSPSNDNMTVAGNDTVTVTVTPSGSNVVETITVTKNGEAFATYTTDKISYSSKAASVTFKADGSINEDEYVVSATYSQNYLTLNEGATIVYCVDDKNHSYDLQKLVFEAIFVASSAPMTKDNVTLKFKSSEYTVGDIGWSGLDEVFNFAGLGHKFGEDGSETIKFTYSDAKYGSFEREIVLNVFDSCYNVTVGVETVTNGVNATIKTQFNPDSRGYLGVDYFKAGESLTVTLTPDGAFLDTLKQMYNGTYADSMAYIKGATVYNKAGNVVTATLTRDQGKLSLEGILQGVNPMLYNAAVTFDTVADEAYKVVVEYGILKLEKKNDGFTMDMYKGGEDYAAKVPSAQDLTNAVLGEDEAAAFLENYDGAFTVEFSTNLTELASDWTAVSDEALLALEDNTRIQVRITWKPADGDKTYYPVAVTAEVTLTDPRTETAVVGEVPTKQVNYLSEAELIAELKEKMGLGITANGSALDVAYDVTCTVTGDETNGYFASVTVTYDGSVGYKPSSKTFENVPVANRPDDATIKVTIQNATDKVTNNDGTIQNLGEDGLYTVIGNGTYKFTFTPMKNYAIESATIVKTPISSDIATVADEVVTLTYDDQVATFSMQLDAKYHYEIVVETVDSVWGLEAERIYDFATGIDTPDNAKIADAATKYPTDISFENVTVEYMARKEGAVTVTLPDIDLGFTVIELGTFDIDLGELWLNPEETVDMVAEDQLDTLLENLVDDIIWKVSHGELAATNALDYIQNYVKNLPLGIHAFGVNGDGSTESIRFSYEDDKYLLAEVVTDVTIHDYRIVTELEASDCEVTYGYSLAQLIAASNAQVTADGKVISGMKIETKDLYLHAKTEAQQVTLRFAGNKDYQPCKVTINVIVNKATCSIDYDSQIVTYGDDYDFAIAVSPEKMPDGTDSDIDMVEFMIGLDAHKLITLDPAEDNSLAIDGIVGLDQAIAKIQLRLPKAIRDLPLVGEYLQGDFTLSELTDLINGLSDLLGIDESSMEILNQVLEAITGLTDSMEVTVSIKDEDFHPTEIGVYIAGAVTVDSDFETAYTADYLIIAPKTSEVELDWNTPINNSITTMAQWNIMDKGASVVGESVDGFAVKYLLLGVNNDGSGILTTDIYGEIKANLWLNPGDVKDNGAYVQVAWGAAWGNEIYYAIPIVRAFVIVPDTVDVTLVGATGTPNRDLLKTYNKQQHGFSVIVKDADGNVIYSDHYQNIVPLRENAQIEVRYIGVQTNGQPYNSTEKPVHAGVYAVTAIYVEFNDGEKIDFENLELEELYELFDLANVGADAGVLVIQPTTSDIEVDTKVEGYDAKKSHDLSDLVHASSAVKGEIPDTTVITAKIANGGDFSADGWSAIDGGINVDFPKWLDDILLKYDPDIFDGGMTATELAGKVNKAVALFSDTMISALEEMGVDANQVSKLTDVLEKAVVSVTDILKQIPDEITLTFLNTEDVQATEVGVYLVIGVVTDSDHYPVNADKEPAIAVGALVIHPNVVETYLKFDYEDENNIWTRKLLEYVDLTASAYKDEACTEIHPAADALVRDLFIGIDTNGQLVTTYDESTLATGAYTQISFVGTEIDNDMYYAVPIVRAFILSPDLVTVNFEDSNGNNARKFTYDGTPKFLTPVVTDLEGNVIKYDVKDMTVTYIGMEGDVEVYNSTKAPSQAGAYVVVALYVDKAADGTINAVGVGVGAMLIQQSTMTLYIGEDGTTTVTYNGEGQEVELKGIDADGNVLKPDAIVLYSKKDADGKIEYSTLVLEDDARKVFDWIEDELGITIPEETTADELTALMEKVVSLAEELGVDPNTVVYGNYTISGMVELMKTAMGVLLGDGTLYIDGPKPVDVGTYDALAVAISANYGMAYAQGTLVIEKITITLQIGEYDEEDRPIVSMTTCNAGAPAFVWKILEEDRLLAGDKALFNVTPIYGGDVNTFCEQPFTVSASVELPDDIDYYNIIYKNGQMIVNHLYDVVTVTEPTCAAQGTTTYSCVCGVINEELTEYAPLKDHVYDEGVATTPATCTAEGVKTFTCGNCTEGVDGHTKTEIIPAAGHTKESIPAVEPTCTATGLTAGEKCSVCGEMLTKQEAVPAKGHSYDEGVVTTAPGCETAGVKTFTCTACDDSYTEGVAATGHSYDEVVTHPTCEAQGYTTHTCSACNAAFVDSYVNALGHDMQETTAAVAPTCTVTGATAVLTCANGCGKTEGGEEVPALGHNMTEFAAAQAPTCTAAGKTAVYICANGCGTTEGGDVVSATGHKMEETTAAVAPGCETTGTTAILTCANGCGTTEGGDVVSATGHKMEETTAAVAPGCETTGTTAILTCANGCGTVTGGEEVPAVGHSYDAVVTAPTCTAAGYTTYTCSVCGNTYTEGGEPAQHTWNAGVVTAPTCTEQGYTTYTCTVEGCEGSKVDNYIDALGHTEEEIPAVSATCTTDGATAGVKCSVCGTTLTAPETIFAKGHSYDEGVVATAPGCETEGVETFTCVTCGDTKTEAIAATGHAYSSEVTTPTCTEEGYTTHTCAVCNHTYTDRTVVATGHSWGEWKVDTAAQEGVAGQEKRECDKCDAVEIRPIGALGHSYTAVVTAPTCTEKGYTTYTCACGDSYVDENSYVDALGHSYNGVETTAPTCYSEGVKTFTCSVCGDAYIEPVDKVPHTVSKVEMKDPECMTVGWYDYEYCSVSECGYTTYAEIPAIGHSYDDGVVMTPATCTADGVKTFTCSDCDETVDGHTYNEAIEATGHTEEAVPGYSATCTEAGLTDGAKCSVCGETVTAQETIPALGHTEESVSGKAATCIETGLTDGVKCSVCGETVTAQETIPALGHTEEAVPGKAATCTETGLTEGKKCSVCDETLTAQEVVPALGHDYDEGVVTIEPTETQPGVKTFTCATCGDTYTEEIAALGHTHSYTVTVTAPTCTEKGYTTYACACGHSYKTDKVAAAGHTGETLPAVAPTCTETGVTEGKKCSVCGETLTAQSEIPALGHSYDDGVMTTDPTCTVDGVKTFTCAACGDTKTEAVPAAGHTGETLPAVAPTCTETGLTEGKKCSVCDETLTAQEVVPALGHDYDEGVVTIEPTETQPGVKTFTCATCGDTYTEQIAALGHTHSYTATVTAPTCTEKGYTTYTCTCGHSYKADEVAAAGHTGETLPAVAPTCTETGLTEGKKCSVCGETLTAQNEIPALGHAFGDWNVVENPSETKEGKKTRTCATCGEVETEMIPVLGHTHVYDEVSYDWDEYYEGAWVTVKCCDEEEGSVTEYVKADLVNEGSKLTFTVKGELKGTTYEQTQFIEIVANPDGGYTLKLPEDKANLMVIIEGYDSNDQTVESLVMGDKEDDVIEANTIFDMDGTTIKVFFVDAQTYMPVMQNLVFTRSKLELVDNGGGSYTLKLPEEMEDTLILIAGYKASGKMVDSKVLDGNKIGTEKDFEMDSKVIKVFFLDAATYMPIMEPLTK